SPGSRDSGGKAWSAVCRAECIVPRWSGVPPHSLIATTSPFRLYTAHEQSRRSLMFVEYAAPTSPAVISSAMEYSPLRITSSVTGSLARLAITARLAGSDCQTRQPDPDHLVAGS